MARKVNEVVLALSGGGARGAYHLGVLHYLDEQNIKIKAICATSIGSIIGAGYAYGVSPKQQLKLLQSKEIKKVFKFAWFQGSIFHIDMNAAVLQQLAPNIEIEDLHIPLHITATNMDDASETIFSKGKAHMLCKASSALTPLFKPVQIKGTTYTDGGFINHIPIKPLFQYDLPIIAVNLHPYIKNKKMHNLFASLKRVIIVGMEQNTKFAKDHCDYLIESDNLVDFSILSLKNFDALFELGYNAAKEKLAFK